MVDRLDFRQLTLSSSLQTRRPRRLRLANDRARKNRLVEPVFTGRVASNQDRWALTSLVISNIVTCGFLKISFSLASALMLRLLAASCSLCFLMYSQIFLVTSVRGAGAA